MNGDVADLVADDVMRDVNPRTIMLVAMLSDQIQTLGSFYRQGMWRKDPQELGAWLRNSATSKLRRNTYLIEVAMMEWMMWGRTTDTLIEVLARDTVIRIDRPRIVALAIAYGRPDADRAARRKKRSLDNFYRRKKRAGSVQVARSNRAA